MQGKNICMHVPEPNAYRSKETLLTFIIVFLNTATKPQYFPTDMQSANRVTKQPESKLPCHWSLTHTMLSKW